MQTSTGASPLEKGDASLFSVVVTAYNNGGTITECVGSLQAQNYQPKEIMVVVDDASTDETVAKVGELGRFSSVTIEPCSRVGRSEARNLGWRKARGEMVMFADGDDVYDPGYLSKAAACMQGDSAIGGVCMGGAPLRLGNGIIARYEASYGTTDSRMKPHPSGPDWAFVYRKECLSKVGGYRPNLSQAEDRDLCARVKGLGYRIGYVPGVNWYHRKPSTFGEFVSKEFHAGVRRVAYLTGAGKYTSLIVSLSPLVFIIVCAVLAWFTVAGSFFVLFLGLASYIGLSWKLRGKNATGLKEKVAFPLVSLSGRLAVSLGTLVGSVGAVFRPGSGTDG